MRFTGFFILFFACISSLSAQELRADFVTDREGGCSPLTITFTNTSTGTTATTSYQWDFGNGNTSALQNPGAFYSDEKSYTVTLTVKDGNRSSVKTKSITVYKKPTADFTFTPVKGCLPLVANFTSTSTAGDGIVSSYNWDFGDGSAVQVNGISQTSHVYFFEQTASVSLTVQNSYGCAGTISKKDIITVVAPLRVDFSVDKTILCDAPGTVTFSNSSTGPGVLNYAWDFGDGTISSLAAPAHSYARKGIYSVKLTVTSSEGCTQTIQRNDYINVGDFTTDFSIPSLVCTERNVFFENKSRPIPGSSTWLIDGAITYSSYGNGSIATQFYTEGTHTIELTNNFGVCQQKTTKQVEIKKTPVVNGFIVEIEGLCGAPVKVNFKDTTAAATSWKWNFNYWADNLAVHASTKQASYTYASDNGYQVQLTATTADGCSSSFLKYVGINRPLVNIYVASGSTYSSCGPLTTKLEARSSEAIASYKWTFSDGGSSTDETPVHTFNNPGHYTATLEYKTVNGCTGTTGLSNLHSYQKPVADFISLSGTTICGNTIVRLRSTSTFSAGEAWYVNGVYMGGNPNHEFTFQAKEPGKYTIKMIAYNGDCSDEITKTDYLTVVPPIPQILSAANTCEGARNVVTFTDGSKQALGWNWDFGDGTNSSYTSAATTVQHAYAATGTYKVVLTATNGICSAKDSTRVYVLVKQQPVLTTSKSVICNDEQLNYTISSLQTNPYTGIGVSYFFSKWQYGDGSNFAGSNSDYNGFVNPLPYTGSLRSFDRAQDKIRVIVTESYFNCMDTSNYLTIAFKGAKAGFEVVTDNVCFTSPVVLRDTSKTQAGNAIVSWTWDFGDGIVQTFAQGGTISHVYANPGTYYVNLRITDASGCTTTSSSVASQMVRVTGPKISFNPVNSSVQLNTSVYFYNSTNYSNTPNLSWQWDFGTGTTSTDFSPTYTFTDPGEYTVSLTATNRDNQCTDKMTGTIVVKDFRTGFTKTVSFVGDYGQCPPVMARFQNTSVNYTRLEWDFGDGLTLVNQSNPVHIYNKPGEYEVKLKVYGFNGLTDVYRDVVVVNTPKASINAEGREGCIGHEALLNAPMHVNASSYTWDFGNGQVMNTKDSFALHQFRSPGIFTPSLVVKDAGGCAFAITSTEKIIIHPNPVITVLPSDGIICKSVPLQLQASGGLHYAWQPATGLSASDIASPLAMPVVNTTYLVYSTDAHGCSGSASVRITVPQPFSMEAVTAAEICKGSSVTLKTSGASTYQWINTTAGLNSTSIPNPVASPAVTTLYKVVGYDQYNCYTDTSDITVTVRPLPSVNAGADQEIMFGATALLNITNSTDVVRWNWSPSNYLSCTNCPAPVSKPFESMNYVVSVYNAYNCMAKDTVVVKAICGGDHIFIPNSFTPNNDGKNDMFTVLGQGVNIVRSLRIYNRWGEIVFEKKNFHPNDNSSAWNGRYKGVEAPTGSYVYFAEMECEAGIRFERKGSVVLVR